MFAERSLTEKEVFLAIIEIKADQYNISENELIKTIQCESNFNSKAHNPDDGGTSSTGLGQFKEKTFASFVKQMKAEGIKIVNPNIKNPVDQLEVMSWAFSKGVKYKKHWTCFSKQFLKNTT